MRQVLQARYFHKQDAQPNPSHMLLFLWFLCTDPLQNMCNCAHSRHASTAAGLELIVNRAINRNVRMLLVWCKSTAPGDLMLIAVCTQCDVSVGQLACWPAWLPACLSVFCSVHLFQPVTTMTCFCAM